MNVVVKIEELETDGYERLALLKCVLGKIWCGFTQFDEYLIPGECSKCRHVGDEINVSFALELSNLCRVDKENQPRSFSQPINHSPSTIIAGAVSRIIDETSYLVLTVNSVEVLVDFESPIILTIDEPVEVRGELRCLVTQV